MALERDLLQHFLRKMPEVERTVRREAADSPERLWAPVQATKQFAALQQQLQLSAPKEGDARVRSRLGMRERMSCIHHISTCISWHSAERGQKQSLVIEETASKRPYCLHRLGYARLPGADCPA